MLLALWVFQGHHLVNQAFVKERFPWWLSQYRLCLRCRRPGCDPRVGKIPWRGKGNPLQYSCLENSMDEEPGGLQSMELQRVGHNWVTNTHFSHLLNTVSPFYPQVMHPPGIQPPGGKKYLKHSRKFYEAKVEFAMYSHYLRSIYIVFTDICIVFTDIYTAFTCTGYYK